MEMGQCLSVGSCFPLLAQMKLPTCVLGEAAGLSAVSWHFQATLLNAGSMNFLSPTDGRQSRVTAEQLECSKFGLLYLALLLI